MIFAELTLDEAEDTILARAVSAAALNLRKGTRLGRDHIAALRQAGVARVLAARLEDGDLGEDEAALRIGTMLARNVMNKGAMKDDAIAAGPATAGRVNLFACSDGVFCADVGAVDAINGHDARISLATLRNHVRVETGQMVATVKIIPFAVPERLVGAIGVRIGERRVLAVRTFREVHIGLIQSRLPSIRETVLARTRDLMEKRAARSGGTIADEIRVAHEVEPLARAIAESAAASDMVVIFSASAVADEADTVPRAIRCAGGEILRIGIPVDPGNLLVLGRIGSKYIIAAPGSARSARENSFDGVLDRLMAGMELDAADLARMGVGGLLL